MNVLDVEIAASEATDGSTLPVQTKTILEVSYFAWRIAEK